MRNLVVFLEEPSAKEFLSEFLPVYLPDNINCRFIVHEGKSDLLRSLPIKLKAWQMPNSVFVVLRDQDAGDCKKIKEELQSICRAFARSPYLIRIAVHELESWYLGDLKAVDSAFNLKGTCSKLQEKRKYRNPDSLANPVQELRKITNNKYLKLSGSREIGRQFPETFEDNKSRSFRAFCTGLSRLLQLER